MAGNDYHVAVFVICVFVGLLILANMKRPELSNEEDAEDDDVSFEYLTVREQLDTAQTTSDALGDMEQLITDMDIVSDDDILVIHIEWLGKDNANHSYDLYADGSNTVTECMAAIAERESAELRRALAYQCGVLSRHTRSGKNSGKNYAKRARGEGSDIDKALSDMRNAHSQR